MIVKHILPRFSILCIISAWTLLIMLPTQAFSQPLIITTIPTLAQIAEAVGGIDVQVKSLSHVGQNPNKLVARPSHVRDLSNANLLFAVGFGLESRWLPTLIRLSANANIVPGMSGYFSADDAIEAVGVPLGMTSTAMQQWSPDINPYWWLDPELGIKVALALAVRLGEIDPINAERYQARANTFAKAVNKALPRWRDYMNIYTGPIITYHNTYVYFMQAMHIELAGFIEPKAGIEPSTRHLGHLIDIIHQKKVRLIWVEPYNNRAVARRLADAANIRLMVLPDSVAGYGLKGYIGMFDRMVQRIARWSQ